MASSLAGRIALLVVLATLLGCQTTMSVEEARKVAASFQGAAFVPPPRTIDDITAILDQQKREDVAAADEARARADESPPATDDAQTLRRFYYRRGLAARAIGRTRQEIEDLTKALGLAPDSTEPYQYSVLWAMRYAELRGGNHRKAIEYGRRAIELIPNHLRGDVIVFNGLLATSLASRGDLDGAQAMLAEAERVYFESLRWTGNQRPEWLVNRRVAYLEGQAAVARARGRYAEAERLHRESIALRLSIPEQARQLGIDELHAFLAGTLAAQGRLLEAENEARAALLGALAKRGRYSTHTAFVLSYLVGVIHEQGRYREAETLARARVEILEKIGSEPESLQLASARGQLALALNFQNRYRESLVEYDRIRAGLERDPAELTRVLGSNLTYGVALLRTGSVDRALEIIGAALEKRRRLVGDQHASTASVRGYLAQAYVARGDRARALAEFRDATQTLLTRSADAEDESATRVAADSRLVGILMSYIELLADVRGTPLERDAGVDAAAEAFRLAEVVRGRSVERALDASAARAAVKTPALAELIRQEQDAKKQMTALQGLLGNVLSAPSDQQDPQIGQALRTQIATLRQARRSLIQQIDREFPSYAQLVNPAPVTLDQARATLHEGEALISVVVLPRRTFVWAIPHRGTPAFAALRQNANALRATVERLRRALDPNVRLVGDIPAFDVGAAHDLYRTLLEPVAAGWTHAESLLVVPHGPLAQLPFTLLVTKRTELPAEQGALFSNYRDVPWLVRERAVTVLPSVGALATLRRLPAGDPSRRPFVGFGDPYFSVQQAELAREQSRVEVAALASRGAPITLRNLKVESLHTVRLAMLPRLPDTADEIRAIARAMNADLQRDVFLGSEANERRVRTLDLARYRVIAFATHGLVPGELDGLTQPALALSAPDVANIEGDGLLTLEKILALRLNADWVVLSACNTASGQGAGSEAISGLGRAFFYAGARALLVSNWPVETTSARTLTTDLFRRQATDPRLSRAKALQQTLNALIDDGALVDPQTKKVVFSYAHPIFWAPFTLVGDGG